MMNVLTESVMETAVPATAVPATAVPATAVLAKWIAEHDNKIEQCSAEWHAARTYCVGGSSIATIMGINPYCTVMDFIKSKLEPKNFSENVMTQWGVMFEPLISKFIEKKYNTVVQCENFFIKRGILAYSPDGLAVINDSVVLLEYKCPYLRIPTATPPKYYIPQVKMGLEMIPIAAYGIFVEAVYRPCTWDMLNTIQYTLIGRQKPVKVPGNLDRGFIGFMVKREGESVIAHMVADYYGRASEPGSLLEFHSISEELLEELLRRPEVEQFYSDGDLAAEKARFESMHVQYILLGILPWKLIDLRVKRIEREAGFLTPWMSDIQDIIDCVTDCLDTTTAHRKQQLISKLMEKRGGGFIDV